MSMPAHRSLCATARATGLSLLRKYKVTVTVTVRVRVRVGVTESAAFSTYIDAHQPMLVRDFIHAALYHPCNGYFSKTTTSGPVGVLEATIKFNQLQGRKAYLQHLNKIYKQSHISWFTPVELFKPWYAHGIAEAILRTANFSVPLKIYEIGGGSGTCAKGIMDYVMLNAPPRVYNNMTYISVEISPSLAEIQKETVGQVQSHKSRFRVECRDAADQNGWGDVQQEPCWVIMLETLRVYNVTTCGFAAGLQLEVLDNLPHDLIHSKNQALHWEEVWVEKQLDRDAPVELYRPLQDRLIKLCIEILAEDINGSVNRLTSVAKSILSKVFPKPQQCWLPTGCLKLMEALHSSLPKMSLIASDFSYLPDVRIPGVRAPLVSAKVHGHSVDYESYLDAKGDADIFFPTDFWLLERIDHYCSSGMQPCQKNPAKGRKKRRTITLDTSAFMEEFGLPSKTRTKDGYNPLLDDFKNTKFYLSVPTYNIK